MVNHGVVKEFKGEHFFLSSFYENWFTWRNVRFRSGEHGFVYAKTFCMPTQSDNDRRDLLQMREAITTHDLTPGQVKRLGRRLTIDVAEWDAHKVQWMREIVHARFLTSDESMVGSLLNTGAKMLVEGNNWNDTFWGRCNGKGFNTLGVILMEERGYWLRSEFNVES